MMKDKHSSEVIYALADYKQLVLAYRSKHTELVKSLAFWKTSLVWLCAFTAFFVLMIIFWLLESGKDLNSNRKNTEMLNSQVNIVSEKLARTEDELIRVKDELKKKEDLIKNLEKNVSTASRKLLEKLLAEQEESASN
jgi:DNA segregation ATPase FtsK/SpoIIIE-like protein